MLRRTTLIALGGALIAVLGGACKPREGPPPPLTELSPQTPVLDVPKPDGKKTKPVQGPGEGGGMINRAGHWDTQTGVVDGAHAEWDDLTGTNVSVEVSVEEGTLRVYLHGEDGKSLHYVEATPGHPARSRGHMLSSGTNMWVRFEAVGGEARGVKYRVWGGRT